MFPFILIGIVVVGALAWAGAAKADEPFFPEVAPGTGVSKIALDIMLGFYLQAIIALKAGDPVESRKKALSAAKAADANGLPKTASAIRDKTPLPTDEIWPGTSMNVREYIRIERLKKGI